MSYQHVQLGMALGWKHPATPRISTANGILTEWPVELLPQPSDADQAQIVTNYLAYLSSNQYKDDEWQSITSLNLGKATQAVALVGVDKGFWTLAELKAKYRSL